MPMLYRINYKIIALAWARLRPHRTDVQVGQLRGAGKAQGLDDGGGDIVGLEEARRVVGPGLEAVNFFRHGGGGAAREDGEHPHAFAVDLVPERVGEGTQ